MLSVVGHCQAWRAFGEVATPMPMRDVASRDNGRVSRGEVLFSYPRRCSIELHEHGAVFCKSERHESDADGRERV